MYAHVELVFVAGIGRTENRAGSITVGVLLHYLILVTWMWMAAEAVLLQVSSSNSLSFSSFPSFLGLGGLWINSNRSQNLSSFAGVSSYKKEVIV